MSTLDNARPGRSAGSLEPEIYDMVEYVYPDDVTIVEIYSYQGRDDQTRYVTGTVHYQYADSTMSKLVKKWRQSCD